MSPMKATFERRKRLKDLDMHGVVEPVGRRSLIHFPSLVILLALMLHPELEKHKYPSILDTEEYLSN